MDGVFFGLVELLLGISLGLRLASLAGLASLASLASPRKTPFIPPLLLGLTQSVRARELTF